MPDAAYKGGFCLLKGYYLELRLRRGRMGFCRINVNGFSFHWWKCDVHVGPLIFFAFHFYLPVELLNGFLHYVQAQPVSFGYFGTPVKEMEDFG